MASNGFGSSRGFDTLPIRFLANENMLGNLSAFTADQRRTLSREVVQFISTSAKAIHDLNRQVEIMQERGSNHKLAEVEIQFYQQVISSLLQVVRSSLFKPCKRNDALSHDLHIFNNRN